MIGILALQGSFKEHQMMLEKLNVKSKEIRSLADTENITALIIPGGESTTMMDLLQSTKLDKWITKRAKKGMPIYGTCAGMILLSNHLKLIDIEVERNAYGPQVASFEDEIEFEGKKIPGIFIRAPKITKINSGIKILATHKGSPVLVSQGNIMVGAFHPELTNDLTIYKTFLSLIKL